MTPKTPDPHPAIRTTVFPRDMNASGTMFGGAITALMDQAAFIEAKRQNPAHRYVTASLQCDFAFTIYPGQELALWATTEKIGRTSIHISVNVLVLTSSRSDDVFAAARGTVVLVAVDSDGKPVPVFEEEQWEQ